MKGLFSALRQKEAIDLMSKERFEAQTRANTAIPVNELARYMEKPQQKHWDPGIGMRVLKSCNIYI